MKPFSQARTPLISRFDIVRSRLSLVVLCLLVGSVFAPAAWSTEITISINPQATFLRTNQDPNALDSPAIDLAALGFVPGEQITIQALGGFCFTIYAAAGCANTDTGNLMIGIFSTSSTLLASNQLNRVAGALASGLPATITSATLFGGIATDVAEDFFVSHEPGFVTLTIPTNANFLFIGASDSHFSDNADPNGNFAVHIASVPEPASLTLLGLGLAGLGFARRKKQQAA